MDTGWALLKGGGEAVGIDDAEAFKLTTKAFADAGVEIAEMTSEDFDAWRELAKETSYPSFAGSVEGGQDLLDMALSVE